MSLIDPLFRVHLAFLAQGLALAVLAALALRLLPARRARLRYAALVLALVVSLALPAIGLARALAGPPATAFGLLSAPAPTAAATLLPAAVEPAPGLLTPSPAPTPAESSFPWRELLVGLWLLGVLVLSLRNLRAWTRVQRLVGALAQPASAELVRTGERLRRALGLRRPVRFALTHLVDSPLTFGWLRPVVLLPASAVTGLSRAELEAVLAHELAHVRRCDYLVNLLQVAAETLLFYHPAVWWLSHRIRVEREHCCDDVAVAACGDAATYVGALAALEERRAVPSFALQANGSGLLARARRLLAPAGREPHARLERPSGAATMIALSLSVATALLFVAPGAAQEGARRPVEARSRTSLEERRGLWIGELDAQELYLELRQTGDTGRRWNSGFSVARTDLESVPLGAGITFDLVRAAGTFSFTGEMQGTERKADGTGRFVFRPSAAYLEEMAELGYPDLPEKKLLTFAVIDLSPAYVRALRERGYRPSLDELFNAAIHDVTPEFIDGFIAAGFTGLELKRLAELSIHDVTHADARELQGLFGPLEPRQLVECKIHDLTPAFAREIRALGYPDAGLKELRDLRIHDVTPAYIREVSAQLRQELPLRRVVEFAIHDVSERFVDDMLVRFSELEPRDFVKLRIHDVTVGFVDEMRELGLHMDVDEAVRCQIHDVTPRYVRRMREEGHAASSVEELVRRRIHGERGGR